MWTTSSFPHLRPSTKLTLLPTATTTAAEAIPEPTAAVYIIECTEMDEQHPCPDGRGEDEGTNMVWMRKCLWPSNTTNLKPNHLLPVRKRGTLHPELCPTA